jgi:polyribonucleotide nucleotidyltransferase
LINLSDNNGNDVCSVDINGRVMEFSTRKLANQANGAILVKSGNNGVLVTATMSDSANKDMDYFPLIVDVEERMYAAGKIPGGFFKREGKASDKAILISRLTDRPIRPIFDEDLRNEVQIVATILSVDQINPYDILVINGASLALYISDIPFDEPVGAVRVAKVADNWVFNPLYEEIDNSLVDIIVAGTENAILMVEAGCNEVSEELVLEAIEYAHEQIKKIIHTQKEFKKEFGKEKTEGVRFEHDPELEDKVRELASARINQRLEEVLGLSKTDEGRLDLEKSKKGFFQDEMKIIKREVSEALSEQYPDRAEYISLSLKKIEKDFVRSFILEKNTRPDGRSPEEIRKITCEVGLFPVTTHGTGLFTRGKTQVLTILALGSMKEVQRIDSITTEESKRFMHHYNFPPFSVGETGFMRGPKRREIGHGALAERALSPMIPDEEAFPYALRLVSEVLESNGSTSMASVCGSTLALMDAGVPIANPVSGIAMGLIMGEDGKFVVLSDIQGIEDFYGDMDFKVAGTANGITALQMDNKLKGINLDVLKTALERARQGRMHILEKMLETIPEHRPSLSESAPKITTFKIPKDKIGEVIGPGGKNVKAIKEEFQLDEIDIYDSNNEGVVSITSTDEKAISLAIKKIEAMLKGVEDISAGDEFLGTVVGIAKYGAFINLIPGVDGLLHISKVSKHRIEKVEDVLSLNEKVLVKVLTIDKRDRKISLERVFQED